MTWLSNNWLELTLVLGYAAMLAKHALAGHKESESSAGYLVAGRNLGGVVVALSFYATFMSTNTFIGASAKSWDHGVSWCLSGLVLTTLACLAWTVVAPRFVPLTREYQSLTVADFLGTHYQSMAVRRFAGVLVAAASILYLIAIYRGASLAIEAFLDLEYSYCVLIAAVCVTSYTMIGGFKSVVMTDAVQGVLMLVGAVVLFGVMISLGGGTAAISEKLSSIDPNLVSWTYSDGVTAAFTYSLAVGVKYLVEPRQLSRFYGLKDAAALKTAAWVACFAILISYLCLLPLGALARAVIQPDVIQDTDQILPHLLGPAGVMGPIAGTLFLLVLVSAAISSIDSVLLVAASTISRDVFRLAKLDDGTDSRNEVRVTRYWITAISLLAAGAALLPNMSSIIPLTMFSGSLYGACFLPVLVIGLFIQRPSAKAAITTMIIGSATVVTMFTLRRLEITTIHEVYPGIAVGVLTYLAMTLRKGSPA